VKEYTGIRLPRTYLVFGDIEGMLDVLRVECTKCDRKGRCHVHKLIEKHGRTGNLMKWREQLNGDSRRPTARPLRPGMPRPAEGAVAGEQIHVSPVVPGPPQ
jgi:hypothetical protein